MDEKELSQREEILKEREKELEKREQELEKKQQEKSQKNIKENFYDNFKSVPVKYIDILIEVCGVAIVVCVILGMLQGRGIL